MSGAYEATYHESRFTEDPRRNVLWNTLWEHYFRKQISPEQSVLDLGAGRTHGVRSSELDFPEEPQT